MSEKCQFMSYYLTDIDFLDVPWDGTGHVSHAFPLEVVIPGWCYVCNIPCIRKVAAFRGISFTQKAVICYIFKS